MGDAMEIGETNLIPDKGHTFYDTVKKKVVDLNEEAKKDADETKKD